MPGKRKTLPVQVKQNNVWGTTVALESETSRVQTLWRGLLTESDEVTAPPRAH